MTSSGASDTDRARKRELGVRRAAAGPTTACRRRRAGARRAARRPAARGRDAGDRLVDVAGLAHDVVVAVQLGPDAGAEQRVVVDEEDSAGHGFDLDASARPQTATSVPSPGTLRTERCRRLGASARRRCRRGRGDRPAPPSGRTPCRGRGRTPSPRRHRPRRTRPPGRRRRGERRVGRRLSRRGDEGPARRRRARRRPRRPARPARDGRPRPRPARRPAPTPAVPDAAPVGPP